MKEIKKILFILTLNLVLISCQDKVVIDPPDNLIEKDQFIKVITDVQLIEATYTSQRFKNDSIKYAINGLYRKVLKEHNIEEEQFKASFNYYFSSTKSTQEIYNLVLANIDQLEQKIKQENPDLTRKQED